MNRRELFKAGAVLAAAPAIPAQALPEIPADMREFIRRQGWMCIDEALPPEGVLISMVRADGPMGMLIATARRYGAKYHCEHGENGVMLGVESAPHGWALYPASITIGGMRIGSMMICSGDGVPYTVSELGGVGVSKPDGSVPFGTLT